MFVTKDRVRSVIELIDVTIVCIQTSSSVGLLRKKKKMEKIDFGSAVWYRITDKSWSDT